MIENEQRETLKPLEVALFIQRRLIAGDTQADIARQLGKSRGYVTFATALIDAPEWLMELYRSGRCKGMQELYAVRHLQKEHPTSVDSLVGEPGPITRERLATVRPATLMPNRGDRVNPVPSGTPVSVECEHRVAPNAGPAEGTAAPRTMRSLVVNVEFEGTLAELVVDAVPERQGDVFLRRLPTRTCSRSKFRVLPSRECKRSIDRVLAGMRSD